MGKLSGGLETSTSNRLLIKNSLSAKQANLRFPPSILGASVAKMKSEQPQANKIGNILAFATITIVGILLLAYAIYPLLGLTAVLVIVLIAPLIYIMAMESMARWMKFKVDRMVYRVAFWWLLIAIIPVLGYLFYPMLGWVAILPAILVGVAVLYFSGRRIRTYWRTQAFQDEADNVISQALQIMDSTSSYYSDEEEANKELVLSCIVI